MKCLLPVLLAPGCLAGEEGFGDDGGDSDADTDSDSDGDEPETVCDLWSRDYPTTAPFVWQPGDAACDPGTVAPEAIDDAVRRTNLFRALSGLEPIVENPIYSAKAQGCAVLMQAIGNITHTPDPASPCYTADAAEAAGSSNLFGWAESLAQAVDVYVGDELVDSLGHRRWILYPDHSEGGFGIAGVYTCQWVMGFAESRPSPPFVAYPAEGDYPLEMLRGAWSVGAAGASWDAADVRVTRLADGSELPVGRVWVPAAGYGLPTLAWEVGAVGEGEYEVAVTGASGVSGEIRYRVRLMACATP